MPENLPEPWLRGPILDVSPLIAPTLYSFQQACEDLAKHTAGLSEAQLWARPAGLPSVGFQLRHIAGSVERLMTYVRLIPQLSVNPAPWDAKNFQPRS